jgi:hypothetical protein
VRYLRNSWECSVWNPIVARTGWNWRRRGRFEVGGNVVAAGLSRGVFGMRCMVKRRASGGCGGDIIIKGFGKYSWEIFETFSSATMYIKQVRRIPVVCFSLWIGKLEFNDWAITNNCVQFFRVAGKREQKIKVCLCSSCCGAYGTFLLETFVRFVANWQERSAYAVALILTHWLNFLVTFSLNLNSWEPATAKVLRRSEKQLRVLRCFTPFTFICGLRGSSWDVKGSTPAV